MARASTTITLYNKEAKKVIAEVFEGEQYFRPDTVTRYNGTLADFLTANPDYEVPEREEL